MGHLFTVSEGLQKIKEGVTLAGVHFDPTPTLWSEVTASFSVCFEGHQLKNGKWQASFNRDTSGCVLTGRDEDCDPLSYYKNTI